MVSGVFKMGEKEENKKKEGVAERSGEVIGDVAKKGVDTVKGFGKGLLKGLNKKKEEKKEGEDQD